jgi:hypothetical protein
MGAIENLLADKPTRPIYHYTTNDGFLGIIQTKALWASKLHYLNDSTEFAYANGLIRKALQHRLDTTEGTWKEFCGKALESIPSIENVHIFVVCFSEEGDLLSQWRGYCSGGVGYSISLEADQLQRSMERQNFRLVRCVYEQRVQDAIVDDLIQSAGDLIAGTSPEFAAQRLVGRIPEVAPALKHPKFAEEREWRLVSKAPVSITSAQVRFRPGRWNLIPYYLFGLCEDLESLRVAHVYVGPNPHMELARGAAHGCMWNARVKSLDGSVAFDIRASAVPYRGW